MPDVRIIDADLRELTYVASIARDDDKRELVAAGPASPREAAILTWHYTRELGGVMKAVLIDGNPEVVFGVTRQSHLTPWLFSGWMWGSRKVDVAMPAMIRWARSDESPWFGPILDMGATRIEVRSAADHHDAHRWILWLGARREAELVDWGRDRTKFVLFAFTLSDFEEGGRSAHVHGKLTAAAATASANAVHRRSQ